MNNPYRLLRAPQVFLGDLPMPSRCKKSPVANTLLMLITNIEGKYSSSQPGPLTSWGGGCTRFQDRAQLHHTRAWQLSLITPRVYMLRIPSAPPLSLLSITPRACKHGSLVPELGTLGPDIPSRITSTGFHPFPGAHRSLLCISPARFTPWPRASLPCF